jgi:hypothetical protein
VLEKKKKHAVRRELQQAQGLYSTGINGGTYNEAAYGCSSAARRSIPAVGGLISAVISPTVDIDALAML